MIDSRLRACFMKIQAAAEDTYRSVKLLAHPNANFSKKIDGIRLHIVCPRLDPEYQNIFTFIQLVCCPDFSLIL